MRKKLQPNITLITSVFISLLLIISVSSKAQNQYSNGFRGGLTLGFNGSQIDGDGFSGYTKTGVHTGVVVELPIAKYWNVSLGIEYDRKGSKTSYTFNTNFPDSSFLFKLNYVEIPVLFHFYYKPRVVLGFGATYGQLLSASEAIGTYPQLAYNGTQWTNGSGIPLNMKPSINNFDLSGIGEGQYILDDHWRAEVRYSYSIVPFASSVRSPFPHHGQFHNLFSFSLTYMLGKPHKYGNGIPPKKNDKTTQ